VHSHRAIRASLLALALTTAACQSAPVSTGTPAPLPVSTAPPSGAPSGLASGRVLYSKYGVDLWTSDPKGVDRAALTFDGKSAGYLSARPSPDGSMVAAERSLPDEDGTSLYLLRTGVPAKRLTKKDTFLDGYAWSPDGRYLAFGEVISGVTAAAGGLTGAGAIGDVHLYDTRSDTDLIVGPGTHPAFSPDGHWLGFAHIAGAIVFADMTALAGTAPVPLSGPAGALPTRTLVTLNDLSRYSVELAPKGMGLIGGPQFSPDGKFVAYAAIEKGPILEAEQVVYIQAPEPAAPPKLFGLGKTGALHHVADLRWSPTAPLLGYTIINAQPHHHWLDVIDAVSGERRELYDSVHHFLDYTWSPDGATIILQVDDGDQWLYFRPDRPGPVGVVEPGGWHPEWCRCTPRVAP
jgi:dipeptidyl aminopeptidase/acylaminoacyl peptidase